ncbi:beta-aspartyl-peptidase [Salmonella enterica subsp. enterica serovar Brijbhumi]|nr:beta-aspartyl-peptidase [Salmonella enterica subsp. enterica serovar Brijbhumi]
MPDLSAAEFTLLQGAHLFPPEDRGICDVLLANGKIIAVGADIPGDIVPDCTVINLSGRMLCPGFIDQHVHLIGGGGEAGPTTRTPEVSLSRLTEAGITTVVGLLGTDSVSRHPASLLAKTRALNEEGITAWMLTGAYHVPSPTITGSVEKDVALIDRVIGVKCAVSDHRSAAPSGNQLASMAAESRVGGLLGGKPGVSVFHMGSSKKGLQPLFDAAGNLTGIGVAGFESLLETLQTLVNHYGFSLTDALRPLTTSVAAFLSLDGKGEIRPGNDADLLVFSEDLRIEQVYARGKRMVNEGKACVKGTFEPA